MQILTWSAFRATEFDLRNRFVSEGGGSGLTQMVLFDPATGDSDHYEVSETDHDMFCPGISTLFNGDLVISGGQDSERSSIYDLSSSSWQAGGDMNIARGYGSSVTLANGDVRLPVLLPAPPAP